MTCHQVILLEAAAMEAVALHGTLPAAGAADLLMRAGARVEAVRVERELAEMGA